MKLSKDRIIRTIGYSENIRYRCMANRSIRTDYYNVNDDVDYELCFKAGELYLRYNPFVEWTS